MLSVLIKTAITTTITKIPVEIIIFLWNLKFLHTIYIAPAILTSRISVLSTQQLSWTHGRTLLLHLINANHGFLLVRILWVIYTQCMLVSSLTLALPMSILLHMLSSNMGYASTDPSLNATYVPGKLPFSSVKWDIILSFSSWVSMYWVEISGRDW